MRPVLMVVCVAFGATGCRSREDGLTYQQFRSEFKTQLTMTGPAPQRWQDEASPPGARVVHYQSDGRELLAWVSIPPEDGKKRSAIIFLHGGFAFGAEDYDDCRPFLDAGYVVMCPTYRGENGNPGHYELFLGEVDDAAAAAKWLAAQPGIDVDRIHAFGHSVGGGVAAVLSLIDDLPVRTTGSAGGLYPDEVFAAWAEDGLVPFDHTKKSERRVRRLLGNTADMRRPHFAYIGKQDEMSGFLSAMQKDADRSRGKLSVRSVPGDHAGSLRPAMQEFLQAIESAH